MAADRDSPERHRPRARCRRARRTVPRTRRGAHSRPPETRPVGVHSGRAGGPVRSIHHVTATLPPRPVRPSRPPSPRWPERQNRARYARFFFAALCAATTNDTTGQRPTTPGGRRNDERAAGPPAGPGPGGTAARGSVRRGRAGPAHLRQAGARRSRRRRADGPERGHRQALGQRVRHPLRGTRDTAPVVPIGAPLVTRTDGPDVRGCSPSGGRPRREAPRRRCAAPSRSSPATRAEAVPGAPCHQPAWVAVDPSTPTTHLDHP